MIDAVPLPETSGCSAGDRNTALLFLLYYGYIALVAWNRPLLARPIADGSATTLAIPLGALVIVGAWILTAAYVVWANRHFDHEARRLRTLALDDSTTSR